MNSVDKEMLMKILKEDALRKAEKEMREYYATRTPEYLKKPKMSLFYDNPRLCMVCMSCISFIVFVSIIDLLN